MATELEPTDPGISGVSRVFRHQIESALASLAGRPPLPDESVHSARKQIKRARATLRLVRDALSDAEYERENLLLRDAARTLTAVRDAKVQLEALDGLLERYGEVARCLKLEGLRRVLRRALKRCRETLRRGGVGIAEARTKLERLLERAKHWPTVTSAWDVIGPGLERTYRKGREAFAAAKRDRTTENLHEWRKQTKYFWHQLQLLEPLRPGLIGGLADEAHRLADYLGEDHDLAVLCDTIRGNPEEFDKPSTMDAQLALIGRRRNELQDRAIALGERLYEEKPKALQKRFGKYWRDWQSETAAAA